MSFHLASTTESKRPSSEAETRDLPLTYQLPDPRERRLSQPNYYFVKTIALQTGDCEYALATATFPYHDTISLVFRVSKQPFDEMAGYHFAPIPINIRADKSARAINYLKVYGKDLHRITKLLLDVHFLFPPHKSLSKYGIGKFCGSTFANLIPDGCAINYHYNNTTSREEQIARRLRKKPAPPPIASEPL
jgi:hypothetical protein